MIMVFLFSLDGLISHIRAINSKCGNNVLHYAIQKADAADILTLFLEHDSSPLNMQNDRGETVLHMACRLGRKKSVELLLVSYIFFFCAHFLIMFSSLDFPTGLSVAF